MADTESVSHGDLIVCACGSKEYCARDVIERRQGDIQAILRRYGVPLIGDDERAALVSRPAAPAGSS